MAMFRRAFATVDEQTSGVTRFDRPLGDQRWIEVVVEVLDAHDRQATFTPLSVCVQPNRLGGGFVRFGGCNPR